MFETDATFQDEMSRLKADADWNAPSKFATLAVFQSARLALKTDAPLKAYLLLGVEPELDMGNPRQAVAAMKQAELVVALGAGGCCSPRRLEAVEQEAASSSSSSTT